MKLEFWSSSSFRTLIPGTLAAKIDAQATADRVSETPTLFIGKTGSKLKPVSSTVTFDAAQLAAAIRALG